MGVCLSVMYVFWLSLGWGECVVEDKDRCAGFVLQYVWVNVGDGDVCL